MDDFAKVTFSIERKSKDGWSVVRLNFPDFESATREVHAIEADDPGKWLRVVETTRKIVLTVEPMKEASK